jgi:hypothetical protein
VGAPPVLSNRSPPVVLALLSRSPAFFRFDNCRERNNANARRQPLFFAFSERTLWQSHRDLARFTLAFVVSSPNILSTYAKASEESQRLAIGKLDALLEAQCVQFENQVPQTIQ